LSRTSEEPVASMRTLVAPRSTAWVRAIAPLLALLAWGSCGAEARAENAIVDLELLSVQRDPEALDWVVKSRIYPEDPRTMVLTLRGGGVSLYDVSEPASPSLRGRWATDEDVEGQDRRGDLLVVVGRAGRLLTFEMGDGPSLRLRGRLDLELSPSPWESLVGWLLETFGNGPFHGLHVALATTTAARLVAYVTAPTSGELVAVDVSDPDAPRQVGELDTGVELVEAITLVGDHGFVGGFGRSDVLRVIDLADPTNMGIVAEIRDPTFRQMVSALHPTEPHVLLAGLWGEPGGLASFDVSDPTRPLLLDSLVLPELSGANRVKVAGGHAFVPLEQDPGGVAVIGIANPRELELVGVWRPLPEDRVYTAQPGAGYVYLFGAWTSSLATLRVVEETCP